MSRPTVPTAEATLILALSARGGAQHGLFTRAQARELGISTQAIDRRVAHGEWIAVDHGVYRFALTPPTWHQRLLAACFAGPAVASHRSAATLAGAAGLGALVEVTARRHRRRKAPDVVWHESLHLDDVDVEERAGIPTTTPARTFVDLASVLDDVGLIHVCDDFVRRRLTTVHAMLEVVERLGARRHGSRRARRVLDLRLSGGATPESHLETDLDGLIRRFGLPPALRQHTVMDGDRFVARLDFAYPDLMVNVEADGAEWHRADQAQARDHRRDDDLRSLGWLVLRFTTWDVRYRPEWVATEIDTALRSRAAALRG